MTTSDEKQNKIKENGKRYRELNKDKLNEKNKKYQDENRELLKQKKREFYAKNKDVINQKRKEKRLEDPDTYNKKAMESYYQNRDQRLERMANYRKNNAQYFIDYRQTNKEKISKRVKKWCEDNRDKRQLYWSNYRSAKLQATPKWLTKEDNDKMLEFYTESSRRTKETGIKHHVDHVMALQGKDFCGLHVPWNLQVLTASENSSKSNKNIEDYSSSLLPLRDGTSVK